MGRDEGRKGVRDSEKDGDGGGGRKEGRMKQGGDESHL